MAFSFFLLLFFFFEISFRRVMMGVEEEEEEYEKEICNADRWLLREEAGRCRWGGVIVGEGCETGRQVKRSRHRKEAGEV